MDRDILPMVAHPERNKDVHRNFHKIDSLIGMGCLFQLTASSLTGQWGSPSRERAIQLLEEGVVTVQDNPWAIVGEQFAFIQDLAGG